MAGQPGNLNATRSSIWTYWDRRALRKKDRWVRPFVSAYQGELISDKGGAEEVTAGESRTIEVASAARACTMLCMVEGDFKSAAMFMKAELQALRLLGLDRRAKNIGGDLSKYLEHLASENNGTPQDFITCAQKNLNSI